MKKRIRTLIIGKFSFKRLVRSTISSIVIFYLFLLLFGYFLSDTTIFPIPKTSYKQEDFKDQLTLKNGNKITIAEVKIVNPKFHIIYSHGNGVDLGMVYNKLERIAKNLKSSVISYDYPGYGTSEGRPSEESVYDAIQTVYNYLIEQKVDRDKIIIWGRSIGGGAATYIAFKEKVGALILESAFTSAFRVVTKVQLLPFDKFPNIDRISKINAPLLIMHGREDTIIPFSHGESLYSFAKDPKDYFWVKGGGHDDLEWIDNQLYWDKIKNFIFLKKYCKRKK